MTKRRPEKDPQHVLVYSTDGPIEKRCGGCQRPENQCCCGDKGLPAEFNPAIRFERKGRGGKTVTVISKLPARETFLKDLCAYLKRSLGTGGTYYIEGEGIIEVQGDRTSEVKNLLAKYKPKPA